MHVGVVVVSRPATVATTTRIRDDTGQPADRATMVADNAQLRSPANRLTRVTDAIDFDGAVTEGDLLDGVWDSANGPGSAG